jgi:hypothetical protein
LSRGECIDNASAGNAAVVVSWGHRFFALPLSNAMNPTSNYISAAAQRKRGLSLAEVMVATVILTLIGGSMVTGFVQNARLARALMLRTSATTVAIGLAEQIRSYSYSDYQRVHFSGGTQALRVRVFDPTDTLAPAGMREEQLPLNVVDGATIKGVATEITVPVELTEGGKESRVPLPLRLWVQSRNRIPRIEVNDDGDSKIVDRCQVFEIALVYQWQNTNMSDAKWYSGVIHILTPNTDMNIPDPVLPKT